MKHMRTTLPALVAALLSASSLAATAGELEHPAVPFLDANGQKVIESGEALSTMKTCGACHDTDYIASHSYHVSLGTDAERAARFDVVTYDGGDPAQLTAEGLEAWIREYGIRHVGGGFATGTEMNCFLCHLETPATEQRAEALRSGTFELAPMATLAETPLVSKTVSGWRWEPAAFDAEGAPEPKALGLTAPRSANCGLCHGAVVMDSKEPFFVPPSKRVPETATTGTIFAPGRIRRSGMNVASKDGLSRPWDVHAERLLECTSCHGSTNNPALYNESSGTRPGHLKSEARRLDIGEFLRTPSHDFAKGNVAQAQAGADAAGSMRTCADCHDAKATHEFLPYRDRHFESMQCEACHIPKVHAAALESTNWTLLGQDGGALVTYRGVSGDPADPRNLVTGYTPVLLPRTDPGAAPKLSPQNLTTVFYWFDEARAARVPMATLRAALLEDGHYRPEVLSALDADKNGKLEGAELHLQSQPEVDAIKKLLVAAGAAQPVIKAELKTYGVHHGVAPGTWAVRDCSVCHGEDARFSAAVGLAPYLPGGVHPQDLGGGPVALAGALEVTPDGGLVYRSDPSQAGMNPLGFEPDRLVDRVGLWLVILTLVGVLIHGGTRIFLSLNPQAAAKLAAHHELASEEASA